MGLSDEAGMLGALGEPILDEQRNAAIREAREMNLDIPNDPQWVDEVAELIESNQSGAAIDKTQEHLDLTGTYRFLTKLCTPLDYSESARLHEELQLCETAQDGPFIIKYAVWEKGEDMGTRQTGHKGDVRTFEDFSAADTPLDAINELLYEIRGVKSKWELAWIDEIQPASNTETDGTASESNNHGETT